MNVSAVTFQNKFPQNAVHSKIITEKNFIRSFVLSF